MYIKELLISGRTELIEYLKCHWMGQKVYVQVVRELGCHFDIYPADTYEVGILKEKDHWMDPNLRYRRLVAIVIDRQTHEQLHRLMPFPDQDLSPMMSVEAFIDGIATRVEIIDALLPLLK